MTGQTLAASQATLATSEKAGHSAATVSSPGSASLDRKVQYDADSDRELFTDSAHNGSVTGGHTPSLGEL